MPTRSDNNAERGERIDRISQRYRARREALPVDNPKLKERLLAALGTSQQLRANVAANSQSADLRGLDEWTRRWLKRVDRKLGGSSDLRSLCQAMLEEAIAATEADFGNVQLVTVSDGALRIAAQRGFGRPFLNFFQAVKADKSACGEARRTGARVVVANVEASSIYTQSARQQMLDAHALACQSTPILAPSGNRLLGIVSTHFRTPHQPTPQQLALVDLIARQAGELLGARIQR